MSAGGTSRAVRGGRFAVRCCRGLVGSDHRLRLQASAVVVVEVATAVCVAGYCVVVRTDNGEPSVPYTEVVSVRVLGVIVSVLGVRVSGLGVGVTWHLGFGEHKSLRAAGFAERVERTLGGVLAGNAAAAQVRDVERGRAVTGAVRDTDLGEQLWVRCSRESRPVSDEPPCWRARTGVRDHRGERREW